MLGNCSGEAAKPSNDGNEAQNSSLPSFNYAPDAREVRFLEEKHALPASFEKAREVLFMHHGRLDGKRREKSFRPSFDVCNLNQSQISARQATSRELPSFSGAIEEWPIFVASYVHSTLTCGYSDEENLPVPSDEKLETMASFGVAVRNICATIRASALEDYMCNVSLMQELVAKLPPTACYQ